MLGVVAPHPAGEPGEERVVERAPRRLAAAAQLGERHVDDPEAPPEAALLEQRRACRGRRTEHLGERLDVAQAAGDALRAADDAVGERRDAAAGPQHLVRGPARQAEQVARRHADAAHPLEGGRGKVAVAARLALLEA